MNAMVIYATLALFSGTKTIIVNRGSALSQRQLSSTRL